MSFYPALFVSSSFFFILISFLLRFLFFFFSCPLCCFRPDSIDHVNIEEPDAPQGAPVDAQSFDDEQVTVSTTLDTVDHEPIDQHEF